MDTVTKPTFIRPIVICLFRNNNRILVSEDYDSVKQDYYCRPIGGGIEPGEHSRDAIAREIREELNVDIENLLLIGVMENLFTCEGDAWHEIIFVYDATLVNRALYEQSVVPAYEQDVNKHFEAKWKLLTELEDGPVRLVPEGLPELLRRNSPV